MCCGKYLWCLVFLAVSYVKCRTIYLEHDSPTREEIAFLKKYGYMDDQLDVDYSGDATYTADSISEALRKMQAFAGLPQTGSLDSQTRKLFKRKRCGVKDIDNKSSRNKRYVIYEGWPKRNITWNVINGASTLPKSRVEKQMEASLAIWAPHGGLSFTRVDRSSQADIKVSFGREEHGDGFPFDGLGHVVAHAFPPPSGSLHFDDDELWGDDPDKEELANNDITDFFAVAVHEVGHALGMCHSDVEESVMYPYYKTPVEKLHWDDIMGMRELYMKDVEPMPEVIEAHTAPPFAPKFTLADREAERDSVMDEEESENEIPDLCFTNYQTIQVIQGKIWVFEEEWVWVLHDRKEIEVGYPKRFHEIFRGLPAHVNSIRTIYEKRNGNIAIFSGRRYWEFDDRFRFVRRGRLSDYGMPSRVHELSTVFMSNYNNKTYLIQYERFWRYDEDLGKMDKGYPKDMSAWRQLPYPVDAAMVWRGDTYFFRGPRFWRFDNLLVAAHEYYPLPTAQVWFPCEHTPDMDRYIENEEP
ncbi:matrix metalloproteinase-2-like [Amyelois transitella]|uniref:matrix metalloproteinase-2-like n=1 Tax=Amyelois transitella TaxID=680683 RepID=UPI00298F8E68|nr:matrix metalloproteinase-2-like [Amyelois transitella]